MCIQPIKLTLPFCDPSQEKQTTCSLVSRTMAVVIGAIALLIGILVLSGIPIPGLSTLGATVGGLFSAAGTLILLVGGCLRCIQESDQHRERSIDFAKITPANYEEYIEVHQPYDSIAAKKGDFVFTKGTHEENYASPPHWNDPYHSKKGEDYLSGIIQYTDGGTFSAAGLEIQDGQFVHYPQKMAPAVRFTNLKDFFNYMFRGGFYQGECTKDMEYFTLLTVDGEEVRYNNPYKVIID